MGLPPSENRKTTKLYLGNLDLFAPKKLKNSNLSLLKNFIFQLLLNILDFK